MIINFARKEGTNGSRTEADRGIHELIVTLAGIDAADLFTFCQAAGRSFDYVLHREQYQYITDSWQLASLVGVMYDSLKEEQAALSEGTAKGDRKAARIRARSCR